MSTSRVGRLRHVVVIGETLLAAAAALGGALVLAGLLPFPNDGAPVILLLPGIALIGLLVLLNVCLRLLDGGPLALLSSTSFQRGLATATLASFVVVMLYGFSRWPSAPLRATPAGFVDKAGRHFDADDFVAFKRWEVAYVLFFLSSMVAGIAVVAAGPGAVRAPEAPAG